METERKMARKNQWDPSVRAWLVAAFVWLFGLGALHAGAGRALGQPPPPPDVDTMIRHMDRELNLTDEQKEKIRNILEEAQQKGRSLMERSRADGSGFRAVRARLEELRKETDARIQEVLRADQYEKWKEMRKEREEHHGPRRGQWG